MTSNPSIEIDDLCKFAPVAYRQATKRGHLRGRYDETSNFYCLYGNILYCYQKEDANSCFNIIFLESSIIKKNIVDNTGFILTTVAGHIYHLFASNAIDCHDWIENIENNKFITLQRKFEDYNTSNLQTQYLTEKQEKMIHELEQKLANVTKEYHEACNTIDNKTKYIQHLELEVKQTKSYFREVENDKLLLLKAKGIIPRILPNWANNRDKSDFIDDNIKIWTGSWNVGGIDPFVGMDRIYAHRQLNPLIPPGYDIYCLGIQDCVSDSIYECLQGLLNSEGYYRLSLDGEDLIPSNASTSSNGVDQSKQYNESSLLGQTYTTIGIFIHRKYRADCKLVAVAQDNCCVAAAVSIFGRTIVFISCQFDSKKIETRRLQYKQIIQNLGEKLGENGFNLHEQFNHIIWFGDMHFSLVDSNGNQLPSDQIFKMLEDHQNHELFDSHDQLRHEKKDQLIFYGFREPIPFPNFYPTYRKHENRLPIDYTRKSWPRECYHTKIKEPFYKGGNTREVLPTYSDRILYHSMMDIAPDLLPECISQKFLVYNEQYEDILCSENGLDSAAAMPNDMHAMIDNYQTIEGDIFNISSHTPVFATFLLKLSHDYEPLYREILAQRGNSDGNIQDVLYVLEHTTESMRIRSSFDGNDSDTRLTANILASVVNEPISGNAASALTASLKNVKSRRQSGAISSDKFRAVSSDSIYSLQDIVTPRMPTFSVDKSDNVLDESLPPPGRICTLLRDGPHKFSLTNFKLFWGTCEGNPCYVKIMFPVPYETIAGEKFVDFFSDGVLATPPQLSPSNKKHRPKSMPNSPNAWKEYATATEEFRWKKVGQSKTGTSAILDFDPMPPQLNIPSTSFTSGSFSSKRYSMQENISASKASFAIPGANLGKQAVPPIELLWKGKEPLEKLHIAIQVKMPASSYPPRREEDPCELITGYCSISLEQVCKAALVATRGLSGSVSIARILLREGVPMYNIDTNTIQREQVTFSCTLNLLS